MVFDVFQNLLGVTRQIGKLLASCEHLLKPFTPMAELDRPALHLGCRPYVFEHGEGEVV